ncbi:MAG: monovalent cation/H(+) antiporter subunit G [Planctomycetota bacterium]
MSILLDILSWIFFVAGGFLCITSSLGLLRFPDFYSRVHAAGLAATLGGPFILFGVMLQTGWTLDTVKLLLITVFLIATGPTGTHAMVKASLAQEKHEEEEASKS